MICVRLMGGLGNQMFQYALGRRLASTHGTELVLDLGWFSSGIGQPSRRYALDCFALQSRLLTMTDRQVEALERPLALRALRAFLGRRRRAAALPPRFRTLRQRGVSFDPTAAAAPDGTLLVGYWQSERYFEPVADEIRRDFVFARDPPPLAREIAESASVGVHVRRGDYATPGQTRDYHGSLEPRYYESAVGHLAARVKVERIFVFSDDPAWSRDALQFELPTTHVSDLGYADWEEMRLLSLCSHQVVANSTFSWWAAWLNDNPEKIVVAPKRWFSDPAADPDGLVPPGWHRL